MNRILVAGLTAYTAVVGSAMAQPYDPNTTFYSDAVLRKALADISQMQEPELRAFAHYLAECTSDGPDDVSRHFCGSAMTAYEIEFGSKRGLDDLIYARSALNSWRIAHPDQAPKDTAKIVEESVKFGKVVAAMQRAASERFHTLKSGK